MGNKYYYKTFEDWCLENNRQDILDLWDYDKNNKSPSEVPAGTKIKYFFKCPNGLHKSESRRLLTITDKPNHNLMCTQCAYHRTDDLIGQVFGDLTVIGFDEVVSKERKIPYWICQCSCGNILSISKYKLTSGKKTICGRNNNHLRKYNNEWITDIFNSEYLRLFRQSEDYRLYRQEVMKKDNYSCVVCGTHKNLEVHHIYSFAIYPSDRLNPASGMCLCWLHHSTSSNIGFHRIYGNNNNTPEQLEEYINNIWQLNGENKKFDVYSYMENFESDNTEIDDSMLIDLYE